MRPTNEELNCLVHNTTEDRLLCLNDVKARLYLPVTVFLGLLIVVGTIGNATVCLVYSRRKSRVSSHYFILYLAALDLLTCVVGMPTEIADLVLPYTFESPWACKVLRFTHSSTIIASSTILIQVAFDRYYRICQLGRQFTANKARLLCVGAVLLGFLCSWPTFLLFGRKTVTRNLDGVIVTGTDCSTDDSMRRTIYPTIYYIFLFSLFGITVTFFAVLYSKIGLTILRRKKFSSGSVTSSPRPPRGLRRSGSRRTPAGELPSSDVSSDQDNGHGNSTASGNSNSSNNSNMSTATSTTTVSTIFPGNLRRFCTRKKRQSHHHRSSTPVVPSAESLHNSTRSKRSVTRSVENIAHGNDDNDDSNNNHCNTATTTTNNSIDSINNLNESNINNLARMIYASYGTSANVVTANGDKEEDNNVNEALPECNDEDEDDETSVEHKTYGFSIAAKTRIYTKNGQPRFSQPNTQHQHQQHHYINTDDDDDNDNGAAQTKGHNSKKQSHQRSSQRQIRVGKTTTVLFAVTLAYILSFFPYLTVMVMRSIIKDLEENLSPVGELAYKLCVKSFFINNAINPLIYSFLNQAFRQDAKQMLKRACCRSSNVAGRPHPNPI